MNYGKCVICNEQRRHEDTKAFKSKKPATRASGVAKGMKLYNADMNKQARFAKRKNAK